MNTLIKVENLSKKYRLGLVDTGNMKDDFSRWWSSVGSSFLSTEIIAAFLWAQLENIADIQKEKKRTLDQLL